MVDNMLNQIIHGDCLEVMREMEDKIADAIVTDPPYFLPATHYNVRSGTSRSLTDLGILEHYFKSFSDEARRVLKDNGFAYVFCDGQSYPVFYVTFYKHFRNIRPLIWDKQVSINGYAWRHQHEIIMFCQSQESPSVPTGDGDILKHRAEPIKQREHLAQKPAGLIGRLIDKTTPKGGVVLDPFIGSGTTAIAALNTGRFFIGIEKEEKYVEIARKRIAEHSQQLSLEAMQWHGR